MVDLYSHASPVVILITIIPSSVPQSVQLMLALYSWLEKLGSVKACPHQHFKMDWVWIESRSILSALIQVAQT